MKIQRRTIYVLCNFMGAPVAAYMTADAAQAALEVNRRAMGWPLTVSETILYVAV